MRKRRDRGAERNREALLQVRVKRLVGVGVGKDCDSESLHVSHSIENVEAKVEIGMALEPKVNIGDAAREPQGAQITQVPGPGINATLATRRNMVQYDEAERGESS